MAGEMIEMGDIIEDAEDAIDGVEEGKEDLPEEEQQEMEEELSESRKDVKELTKMSESFEKFKNSTTGKVFKFVGQNVVIGLVLWGINWCLNKLSHHGPQPSSDVKKKLAAVKALTTVIKTQTHLSKKTLDWMKEHQDDVITLDEIEVPLESVIAKYIGPISESLDGARKIAKKLKEKLDGKVQYKIPTGEDMREFLAAGDSFLKGYSDLVVFIPTKVQKIKQLATFPVKQADVDLLTSQLKDAKDLPLW